MIQVFYNRVDQISQQDKVIRVPKFLVWFRETFTFFQFLTTLNILQCYHFPELLRILELLAEFSRDYGVYL